MDIGCFRRRDTIGCTTCMQQLAATFFSFASAFLNLLKPLNSGVLCMTWLLVWEKEKNKIQPACVE